MEKRRVGVVEAAEAGDVGEEQDLQRPLRAAG